MMQFCEEVPVFLNEPVRGRLGRILSERPMGIYEREYSITVVLPYCSAMSTSCGQSEPLDERSLSLIGSPLP